MDMACDAMPVLASGCMGNPWTLHWLLGRYLEAPSVPILNVTISPQAISSFKAQVAFTAGTHCPQEHLHLRTKFLSLAWGCLGKKVVLLAVLQKDSRGSVLLTFQGCLCCASFLFPEMLPRVSTFLYSAPELLGEKWKHKRLQEVLQHHTENHR